MKSRCRSTVVFAVIAVAAGMLPAAVLGQVRPPASPPPQAPAVGLQQFEGDVDVFYEDYDTGGVVRYFLNSNGRRYELRFDADPPGLQTGDRVRLQAAPQPDGTLRLSSGSTVTMLTTVQQAALGPQATIVILVNFESNPVQPYTLSQAQKVTAETSTHFWLGSYEQTTVEADVVGWFTVAYASSNCDSSKIASLAEQAATNAGVNLSNYRRRVYAFPKHNTCNWWGLGTVGGNPSKAWINGTFALKVVGHELGHNLGLYHAMALECGSTTLGTNCSTIEYGNTVDIMGNPSSGNFNLFGKERLGWVGAGGAPPHTPVTADGTYWIETYESLNGNSKGLKILKSTNPSTGKQTFYYVEFRQPIDSDSFLKNNTNVVGGVVITTGSESSANSSYLLDLTPETSSWSDPALVVGRSFTDPDAAVTIQSLSAGAAGANVLVTFGPTPCIRGMPKLTIQPSGGIWVAPGAPVSYVVTVTNTDNASCAASGFDLAAAVPAGWTAIFDSPTLVIMPGSSGATGLVVTAPAGAPDGYYTVGVSATNSADALFAAEATILEAICADELDVKVWTDKTEYRTNEWITITAVVRVGRDPVAGAKVTFTVQKGAQVEMTATATTDASGTAVTRVRFKPKPDPSGNHTVIAVAEIDTVNGDNATTFTVK